MILMESYAELFDYSFTQMKDEMFQSFPQEHQKYMNVESSTRPFEKRGLMGGLGLPVKNRDAQPIPFQDPVKGLTSIFVPVTYRVGYMIDRQSVEDELWGMLANRPKMMLRGSVVIKDMLAADVLNNGLVLQGYDLGGTALFSTAHVREDNGGTYSNLINEVQPITVETVFNAVAVLLNQMTDSSGLPITYTGKVMIYVPIVNSELWKQGVEVANSVMNPGTSDNAVNALTTQFSIEVVPLRYLTNPNIWFIGWEPSTPGYGLTLINRVEPDISPLQPFGDNLDVWYSRLRMRVSAGYEGKRGIAAIGAA